MLLNINHTAAQDSFAADCFISKYVQGGVLREGNYKMIFGPNITEIYFTTSVNGCEARAGFLVELFS